MVNTLPLTLALVAFVTLSGCGPNDKLPASESQPSVFNDVIVWTDKDTGCQYVGANSRGFWPRMGADGKQVCK